MNKEICLGCKGKCCIEWSRNKFDTVVLLNKAAKDTRLAEKMLGHINKIMKIIDNNYLTLDKLFEKTPEYIHSFFLEIENDYNRHKNTKKCLFYKGGCIIYKARPNVCRNYTCDRLN